jgi:hypothetical protein
MGVDMKVKAIYDSEIGNITRSEKNWKDVLKVAGQLYRYEFDNIVMVTAQRPPEKSTLMADYDTWKKVGRYVKRGAKGCAIFPSRALNPRMRYGGDYPDSSLRLLSASEKSVIVKLPNDSTFLEEIRESSGLGGRWKKHKCI